MRWFAAGKVSRETKVIRGPMPAHSSEECLVTSTRNGVEDREGPARFWGGVLLYGFLFGTPLCFLYFFVPIINQAHSRGVSLQDITLYQLREKTRLRFEGYDP